MYKKRSYQVEVEVRNTVSLVCSISCRLSPGHRVKLKRINEAGLTTRQLLERAIDLASIVTDTTVPSEKPVLDMPIALHPVTATKPAASSGNCSLCKDQPPHIGRCWQHREQK